MSAENPSSSQEQPKSTGGDSSSSGPQRPDNMYQTPFDSGSSASSQISTGRGSEVSSYTSAGDAAGSSQATSPGSSRRGPDGSGSRISATNAGRRTSSSSETGAGSSSSSGPELYTKEGEFKATGDPKADLDRWQQGVKDRIKASQDHFSGKTPEASDSSTAGATEKVYRDGTRVESTVDADGRTTASVDMGARGRFNVSDADNGVNIDLPDGVSMNIERPEEAGRKTVEVGNGVTAIIDFKEDGSYVMSTGYLTLGPGGTRIDTGTQSEIDRTIDDPHSWLNESRDSDDRIQRHTIGGRDYATIRDGDKLFTETSLPDGMIVRVERDLSRPGEEIVHYPNGTRVHLGPEKTVFDRDPSEETNPDKRKEAEELADFLRDESVGSTGEGEDGNEEMGILDLDADKYLGKNKFKEWKLKYIIKKALERGDGLCIRTERPTKWVEQRLISQLVKEQEISSDQLRDVMILGEKGVTSTTYDAQGKPQHDVEDGAVIPIEFKTRVAELLKQEKYGGGSYTVDITHETSLSINPRKEVEKDKGFAQKVKERRALNKALKEMMAEAGLDNLHDLNTSYLGGNGSEIRYHDAGKQLEERKYFDFKAAKHKEKEEELHPTYY